MRPCAPLALATLALATLGAGAGCETKRDPSVAADAGAPNASPASPAGDGGSGASARVSPAVGARPRCNPTTPGGNLVPGTGQGLGALSLAVAKDKALLVDSTYGTRGKADLVGYAQARRIHLGATGAAEGELQIISDAPPVGQPVLTWGVAMPYGGDLGTLTFTTRQTAADCTDGVMTLTTTAGAAPRHVLLNNACRNAHMMRGAARGALGIVFLDGSPADAKADTGARTASADVFIIDSLTTPPLRVRVHGRAEKEGAGARDAGSVDDARAVIDSPAVAVGATSLAAAWIVAHDTVRDLHVVRLGRKGEREGKVEVLDKANVGTVTLAFDGEALHVVWSSFRADRNRYVLHWSKWPAGGAPLPTQALGTGVLSAFAPSLAVDEGRFLLAWAEGDEKSATVKVGASRSGNGLSAIPGVADIVSTTGANGREPVVAMAKDTMFVAWKELAETPRVRATAINCSD